MYLLPSFVLQYTEDKVYPGMSPEKQAILQKINEINALLRRRDLNSSSTSFLQQQVNELITELKDLSMNYDRSTPYEPSSSYDFIIEKANELVSCLYKADHSEGQGAPADATELGNAVEYNLKILQVGVHNKLNIIIEK